MPKFKSRRARRNPAHLVVVGNPVRRRRHAVKLRLNRRAKRRGTAKQRRAWAAGARRLRQWRLGKSKKRTNRRRSNRRRLKLVTRRAKRRNHGGLQMARRRRRRRRNALEVALANPRRRRRGKRRNSKRRRRSHRRVRRSRRTRRSFRRARRTRRSYRRSARRNPRRRSHRRRARHSRRRSFGRKLARAYFTGRGGRVRLNRRRRRRHARRNPRSHRRFSLRRNGNEMVKLLGAATAAWLASRVIGGLVNRAVGYLPASITSVVGQHMPLATSILTVLAADQATKRIGKLRQYRTPIMIGCGLLVVDRIVNGYVAQYVPSSIAPWLGLGQIPAYWQAGASSPYQQSAIQGMGMGEYLEVPPGVGMGALQEAAAGLSDYIEVPPGVGMGAVQEAAAGLGEYVEVPPGMQGLGVVQEAAAGLGNGPFSNVGAGYEGARIAAGPAGMMPVPATLTPGEAAYESDHAGGKGLFAEGGIFG